MGKKILNFFICFLCSAAAVYLSGYGNLTLKLDEGLAVMTFLGVSLLLAVIVMMILELYLANKSKIKELNKKIEELENKIGKQ